jgi:hypothetical protein
MSKSKSIVENDFDEFENLPYYNKYKDREISEISNKEFEDRLDLNNHESNLDEDENTNFKSIPLSSKKMFDEEDNRIKEFVEEEMKEDKKKSNKKKTKENVNKAKSMKKKKSKK